MMLDSSLEDGPSSQHPYSLHSPSLSLFVLREQTVHCCRSLFLGRRGGSRRYRFPPLSRSVFLPVPPPSLPVLCLLRCSARLPEWSALFPAPLRRPDPLLSGRAEGEGGRGRGDGRGEGGHGREERRRQSDDGIEEHEGGEQDKFLCFVQG